MSKKKVNEDVKDTLENTACEETEKVDYEKLLKDKEDEILAKNEQYQRLLAEYDNFKKRTVREKEAIYTDSVKDTVAELLPVIDNLLRALGAFDDKESEQYKGVEMI